MEPSKIRRRWRIFLYNALNAFRSGTQTSPHNAEESWRCSSARGPIGLPGGVLARCQEINQRATHGCRPSWLSKERSGIGKAIPFPYLDQAVVRWEKYLAEFVAQDKELSEKVEAAQSNLKEVQTVFNALREQAGETPQEAETLEDEDEMKVDPATKLQEGILQMTEGLKNLKQKAAEILEPESKRICVERAALPLGGRSMMPFQGGGAV